MNKCLIRGNASITTGLSSMLVFRLSTKTVFLRVFLATLSIRHAHTDIQVPNFDYYRRKSRLDPSKSYRDAGDATSPYSYLTPIGKFPLY
jgi:hypothetical protein